MNILTHGEQFCKMNSLKQNCWVICVYVKKFWWNLAFWNIFTDRHFHQQTVLWKICVYYYLKTVKTIASTHQVFITCPAPCWTLYVHWNLILTNPLRIGGAVIFFMTLRLCSYCRAESRLESGLLLLGWIKCVLCWAGIPGQELTGNCVLSGSLRIKWNCTFGVAMLLIFPSILSFCRIGHGPVLPMILVPQYSLPLRSPPSLFFFFLLCGPFKEIWLSSASQVFFGNFNPVSGLNSH